MNREEQRKVFQKFMSDPDMIEKAIDKMEYDQRNLKKGDNVIHLSYSGSVIPEEDIIKFEKQLESEGLKLSYIDTDKQITANFFDINNEILFEYIKAGVIGSAAWKLIEVFTLYLWEKGKAGMLSRLQSGEVTKHQPITAILVSVEKHKSITYVLPNDLPSKTVKKAIDNLMDETKIHQKKYEGMDAYVKYYKLRKNGMWKHINPEPTKKQKKASKELLKKLRRNLKA